MLVRSFYSAWITYSVKRCVGILHSVKEQDSMDPWTDQGAPHFVKRLTQSKGDSDQNHSDTMIKIKHNREDDTLGRWSTFSLLQGNIYRYIITMKSIKA